MVQLQWLRCVSYVFSVFSRFLFPPFNYKRTWQQYEQHRLEMHQNELKKGDVKEESESKEGEYKQSYGKTLKNVEKERGKVKQKISNRWKNFTRFHKSYKFSFMLSFEQRSCR